MHIEKIIAKLKGTLLPESEQWTNRIEFTSSYGQTYVLAQNRKTGEFGCSCRAWVMNHRCKHFESVKSLIGKNAA